jgi:hypothetical protein
VNPTLRMLLELPEDGDVARIANFFRKVRRVENELGLKISILFSLRQKSQINANIEVFERIVDKTGMTGFISRHEFEKFGYVGIGAALAHLSIEHAA